MLNFLLGFLTFFALIGLALVWMMCTRTDPALDKTARFMNALACVWAALKQRHRLFTHVTLTELGWSAEGRQVFADGDEIEVVIVSRPTEFSQPMRFTVNRPYAFLRRDWMESMGFRRDDGRVT